jgi:hypothetical protein
VIRRGGRFCIHASAFAQVGFQSEL